MAKRSKKKKKNNLIKDIIYFIVFIIFIVVFLEEDEEGIIENRELIGKSTDSNQTWAIYWYLCGSDLESGGGAASDDFEEMLKVNLPENVKVIIQTGGASRWENSNIDSYNIERYLYSSKGLELIEKIPKANMGSTETLSDFLKFSKNNYPADKKMVLFWNHGGGSVAGAAFDENYNYDSLTLEEFYNAFDSVYELSEENPPFEVIGFDACLMATIDTAYTFADIGKYLVASEEFEPGSGWNYTDFLDKLAKDPGMDGARLGQHICDTYMDGCGWLFEDEATLSVIDLKKAIPLFDSYENMGLEALNNALKNPNFFSDLGLEAEFSMNYGGNTRSQGYSNMVDLGDLAKNCEELLPKNGYKVINNLKDCVIYQVKGIYREEASGLSCYYSYNGDLEDFYNYLEQGCSDSFKYLYSYEFLGELPPEGMEYLRELGYKNKDLPNVPTLDLEREYKVNLDDDGYAIMNLNIDVIEILKNVYCDYAYLDEKNNKIVMLGQDNDMEGDFDKGIFKDNFRGVWGSIDGHIVYMEIVNEGENHVTFSIPILLNDKEYNLRVIYDYRQEEYKILGARKNLNYNGMADKNYIKLKPGDKITTLFFEMSISGNEEIKAIPKETFVVTEDTRFEEKDLKDGSYFMMYELVDSKNNSAYSEIVEFNINGDNMDVEIME